MKRALITGGTAGIGRAAAVALARMDFAVTVHGRDAARCAAVAEEIRKTTGNASVDGWACDLTSMKAVREAVGPFKAAHPTLDVLILNAGMFLPKREVTDEGNEKTFAGRFLGHFLLTESLLPLLEAAGGDARVMVTGSSPGVFRVHFDDVNSEKKYSWPRAIANSMAMLLSYVLGLSRRYAGKGVTANFMHPGLIDTGLFGAMPWWLRLFMKMVGSPPEQGADTLVYLASEPGLKGVTGKYFKDRREIPFKNEIQDPAIQERVLELGKKLTGS